MLPAMPVVGLDWGMSGGATDLQGTLPEWGAAADDDVDGGRQLVQSQGIEGAVSLGLLPGCLSVLGGRGSHCICVVAVLFVVVPGSEVAFTGCPAVGLGLDSAFDSDTRRVATAVM